MKVEKVLVPTDFSKASEAALSAAVAWAKLLEAKVSLVHVYFEPLELVPDAVVTIPGEEPEPLRKLVRRLTEQKLEARLAELRKQGVEAEGTVVTGEPSDVIVQEAERQNAGLIIIGTRGRTGLKRAVLGSVAEEVVRRSPVPVLTLHATAE